MSDNNPTAINTNKQRQRLTEIIKNKYKDDGGYIDGETLFIGDQNTSLSP